MLKKIVNLMLLSVLLLLYFCVEMEFKKTIHQSMSYAKDWRRRSGQKMFLFYRSNNINERACECPTMQSCRCCESVTLLLIKTQKRLCANIMYQRNGLNVDISLDADTVRTLTITNYRPVNICTQVPGSLFSTVCLNLVELNAFSRSLTVCPRFTISSKHQEWRIGYTCVSISTELPAVNETTPAPGAAETVPGGPMTGMIMGPMNQQTMVVGMNGGNGGMNGANGANGDNGGMNGDNGGMNGANGANGGMNGANGANGAMNAANGQTMPPAGMNGPPPGGLGATPPTGMNGTPPAGTNGPPPGGMAGPPPGGSANPVGIEPARSGIVTPDRTKLFPSRLPPAYALEYANYSIPSFG